MKSIAVVRITNKMPTTCSTDNACWLRCGKWYKHFVVATFKINFKMKNAQFQWQYKCDEWSTQERVFRHDIISNKHLAYQREYAHQINYSIRHFHTLALLLVVVRWFDATHIRIICTKLCHLSYKLSIIYLFCLISNGAFWYAQRARIVFPSGSTSRHTKIEWDCCLLFGFVRFSFLSLKNIFLSVESWIKQKKN